MKALLMFLLLGSNAFADTAPAPAALNYDCMIMNLTSDGSKVKFYEHKQVALTDGQKVVLHKHGGLTYQIEAYSLKDGPAQGMGNLEASITRDSVPLPHGVVANASIGFASGAPASITAYGWHTRVISCAKVP